MNCGIILLLISLAGLGSYSNAAPIFGPSEECCSLSSSCYWLGVTSRRLCLPPPCDRWNLSELCAEYSSTDISGDILTNNVIPLALLFNENKRLRRFVAPQLDIVRNYPVYFKAPAFKTYHEQIQGTNIISKPGHYTGKYGSLGNANIRTYFPQHKLFESKITVNKAPQPNELLLKVILPFPAKDVLTMGFRLFHGRQYSHNTSESPEAATNGNNSSKTGDQINTTTGSTQITGIETSPEQSGKLKKEKENSNFEFQSLNDTLRKLVSKRSSDSFRKTPSCFNVDGSQSNSRPRGRSNVHISISRSDDCGMSASAAHHGSSFAFGNGHSVIGHNYRMPTLRQSILPDLPSLPQLPELPRFPNMPFF